MVVSGFISSLVVVAVIACLCCYLFFNDTATTEIYTYGHTLSLHDALPISLVNLAAGGGERSAVRFGHPSGTLRVGAEATRKAGGDWSVKKAKIGRAHV